MTIFEYIDDFGDYTFNDKAFNEVDSMIFSFLSYINFQNVIINGKESIESVGKRLFLDDKKINKIIIAENDALKIYKSIMNKKRYKDCLLFNYVYEVDNESQFSAISIEYLKNHLYISYEGTDEMISGWYEDFLFSYQYPTKSHLNGINYLKKYTFTNYSIIVGGHSKGGNIALVSSMNTNFLVRRKITDIYSFDGPGILPNVFNSRKYKRIKNKYYHIVPETSLVGVLLENSKDIVIKTSINGILAHDVIYWDISNNYITRSKLSYFSKTLKKDLNNYIYSLTNEELEDVIGKFYNICNKIDIKSIIDFSNDNSKIILFLKEVSKLDIRSRRILINIIDIFIKALSKSISFKVRDNVDKLKEKIKYELKFETKKIHR